MTSCTETAQKYQTLYIAAPNQTVLNKNKIRDPMNIMVCIVQDNSWRVGHLYIRFDEVVHEAVIHKDTANNRIFITDSYIQFRDEETRQLTRDEFCAAWTVLIWSTNTKFRSLAFGSLFAGPPGTLEAMLSKEQYCWLQIWV